MENQETKKKEPRKTRAGLIDECWNAGIKTRPEIAAKLQEFEAQGNMKFRKEGLVRDEKFYLSVANWYLIQLAKKGKIDMEVKLRPRKPKVETATNEEAQQMVNSGEATIPTEAVVAPEVAIAETKTEEAIVTL